MPLIPTQQYWPLITAGVWYALAAYQVYRDRYRTWTEAFFLAACFFTGSYALTDVFFFTAPTTTQAANAALIGFTFMTFVATFLFLFAIVFYTRMRRVYLLAFLPAFVLLPFIWSGLVEQILPLDPPTGPPWVGNWDSTLFILWVGLVFIYAVLAALALLRTYLEVSSQTTKLRRRMLGLLVTTLLAVVLGTLTNVLRGVTHQNVLPLFSTGLALPGIVAFITLSPTSPERFSVAVRRWKASRYNIKAAFLIFTDGTLIGAKIRFGEKVIDQDLFGATLDVIQNFMRTSFPGLRGSLSAIKHGEYTLVMERGRHAYLTVVLQGEENDQLRRHMRDLLLEYERNNQPVLADWRGIPAEAIGTDSLLNSLLEEI